MTVIYYSIKRTDWNRGRRGFFVTQFQRMYWVEERSVATLYSLEAGCDSQSGFLGRYADQQQHHD
jgi:hypothetical protein